MVTRWKDGSYVDDSTKGTSMIRPKTYKKDVLVQAWLDGRHLATLSEWLDTNGVSTRFLSEVVQASLRVLAGHLVDLGDATLIDDTTYARDMLRRKYRITLNPSGRGLKNVQHNMVLTEERRKLRGRINIEKVEDERGTPVREVLDSEEEANVYVQTKQAMEIYKEFEKTGFPSEKKNVEEEHKKAVEDHLSKFEYDENGVIIKGKDTTPAQHLSKETVAENVKRAEEVDENIKEM